MKNLFSILLGMALLVGCQPAGDDGVEPSDDADVNTTSSIDTETTTPVSVVKFSVPGMT